MQATFARTLMSLLGGVTLLLLTTTSYVCITSYNPFASLVGGGRVVANGVAFSFLLVLIGYWSAAFQSVVAGAKDVVNFAGAFLVSAALMARGGRLTGSTFDDFVRFTAGRHSWWLALVISVISLPWGISLLRSPVASSWKHWCLAGGIALSAGLIVYVTGDRYSVGAMLAKIVLILLIPTASLLGIALRLDRGALVRILAGLGALVGVATATIR